MINTCQIPVHISWSIVVVLFMTIASYHKNHSIYIIWYYIISYLFGGGPSVHIMISLIISIWHTAIKMVMGGFVPVKPLVKVCVLRFYMMTSSNGNITFSALLAISAGNSPVPGEFPTKMPVTRSFDVFFDLRLNKRLSKQSWGWWLEALWCPLWCHRNDICSL